MIISLLFFLQFIVLGITQPVMSLYCRDYLAFSGVQTGMILSSATVAAIFVPIVTIFLADRVFKCETLLAFLQIISGIFLCILPGTRNFISVFALYLLVTVFCQPNNALLNAIAFKSLKNQGSRFGNMRVFGTLGWIFAALFLTFVWLDRYSFGSIFYVAAAASFLGSLIIFLNRRRFEPAIVKKHNETEKFKFSHLKKNGFIGFLAICFVVTIQDKYYFLGISPFLKDCGFLEKNIISVISIGMMSEVVFMILLSRLLKHFGMVVVMMIGASASFLRYLIFILCQGSALVVCGVFFHGLTFAMYMAVAYIYLDGFCTLGTRAAMHQFYSLVTTGLGSLFGNMIGGYVFDFTVGAGRGYALFWVVPCILSLAVVLAVPRFIYYNHSYEKG